MAFRLSPEREDRSFLGATVATAHDGRIAELREYAVTAPLYIWEGDWR
jgi:hypothetical protein